MMAQPYVPPPPFRLSQQEVQSSTSVRLVEHYKGRLQTLREKNDGSFGEAETARLRGRIEEIKVLLELLAPANKQAT